jgi:hypothetical protein
MPLIDMTAAVFRKKGETVSRHIAGETILVPVMGSLASMQRIFAMNPVGEFIWSRLDGIKSLGQIAAEIASSFNISHEQALADTEEFIRLLLQEDLLETAT